jgi:hypothetical protein
MFTLEELTRKFHALDESQKDMVFVASHNVDTVELAKKLTEECGLKES